MAMDIIVSCKNFNLTPSLKAYVEDKVGKLARFWERILRARVELEVDKNRRSGLSHRVAVTLEVPGPDIRVTEEAADIHAAIALTMPTLERLIIKAKDKMARTNWRHLKRAKEKFRGWYEQIRRR